MSIFNYIQNLFSTDSHGEHFDVGGYPTLGTVVDTDDPLQQGRLRIFCATLGDNPKKLRQIPWANYSSPYGGVINNKSYARGTTNSTTSGPVAYGFWGIPDMGAQVIVSCLDGDVRKRIWIGCVYNQQQTQTILNGRYSWKTGDGTPDGPLSSSGSPVEPTYSNLNAAFGGNKNSAEWKTRVGEYGANGIFADDGGAPTPNSSSSLDENSDSISDEEAYPWVKGILGQHGYDWSGFKNLGGYKASKVTGFTTPGGHTFFMDDRPYNCKIKFRTAGGHTLILDDTNERIYAMTAQGNSWFEMDTSGNIDVYSSKRVSIHSQQDLNLCSDQTVRITGKQGVYIFAGENPEQADLTDNPTAGQIRMQSTDDFNVISENFKLLSYESTALEIGTDFCQTVGNSYYLQTQDNINMIANTGNFDISVGQDMNINVGRNFSEFAVDTTNISAQFDVQTYSFGGNVNIGSLQNVNIKSMQNDVTIQTVDQNGTGNTQILSKTPKSQTGISDSGISNSTDGSMNMQLGGSMNMQSRSPSSPLQSQPLPADLTPSVPCNIPPQVPLTGSGVDLAARAAWNAGFRGSALVMAVAISGAESGNWKNANDNTIGDKGLVGRHTKGCGDYWGPSIGWWQVRSINNPSDCSGIDGLRIQSQLTDLQYNANTAYAISKQGTDFGPWSTYTSGLYSGYAASAKTAVESMCSATYNLGKQEFTAIMNTSMQKSSGLLSACAAGLSSSFQFGPNGVSIQSLGDINFNSLTTEFSTNLFSDIVPKINSLTYQTNLLGYSTALAISEISNVIDSSIAFARDIGSLLSALESFVNIPPIPSLMGILPLTSLNIDLCLAEIPSNYMPYLPSDTNFIFNFSSMA